MIRLRTSAARTRTDLSLVLACLLTACVVPAGAQEPPAAQPDAPAAAAPPAPPEAPAGPFGTIGRFLDNSFLGLSQGFKGARDQVDDLTGRAGNAATDAAGTVKGLRRPGVVAGREHCPKAPNGAPDCVAATLALCRANGFESGSSVDMQTEEKCPPTVTQPGPASPPTDESECWLESYVIRALCR